MIALKKRFFILACLCLLCTNSVWASPIEIKNIYAQVECVPSGAGEVYIKEAKSDDTKYVKEKSGWGDTSYMKATLQKNDSDPDQSSMYEAMVSAKANDDYEFVCYSYEKEVYGDVFLAEDIFWEASSTDGGTRVFTRATEALGVTRKGAILNVVSGARSDGDTDDPGRDNLFNKGTWSETPDRTIYAIFRKKGDVYPCLEELMPVEEIEAETQDDGKTYNLAGQQVDDSYKGIVIKNGKKYLRR